MPGTYSASSLFDVGSNAWATAFAGVSWFG
jgi:hypothetical protein